MEEKKDETAEVYCEIIQITDDAVLVNNGENQAWLPLSQVITDLEEHEIGDKLDLEAKEWILKQQDLI